jgi:hypothetical protein
MFNFLQGKIKNIVVSCVIFLFVFAQIVGLFLVSTPVQALTPIAPGYPVFDASVYGAINGVDIKNAAKKVSEDSIAEAIMGSVVHAVSFATRKLAYDSAMWVASGGKGQMPLAFWQNGNDHLESVLLDSAADAIGELGKPFGLNLCQIPDLRFQVFLQVGLRDLYGGTKGPQPSCTFQQLTEGGIFDGGAWKQRYGTEEGLAETFSAELSVRNTDFGVALGAIKQVDEIRALQKEAAIMERTVGQGFKPVTDLITGNIKTPAQQIKEETKAATKKHGAEISASQMAGIYGSSLKQLPTLAASVFLNTLTSKVLDDILKSLLTGGSNASNSASALSFYASAGQDNRERAKNALSALFTIVPTQLTNYPILAEFAACPEDPGLNNCVIDSTLHQALAQSKIGNAMTISEALEEGKLNGSWRLISPRHKDHQDIQACQVGKYCYSNIQKLRKLRALPLGFEIAALRSDPEQPWTLQQVVDGFEDCARPNPNDLQKVVADDQHPFCHLINPNWVLAIPDARCESQVRGPKLVSINAATRREECVDIATCLATDEHGTCIDYGYCTREKNVWQIGGKSCPAEYSTCTTYTNTSNNVFSSYLARTVDYGDCSIDTVGCQSYSLEKASDTWVASPNVTEEYTREGRNQTIHFNAAVLGASNDCDSSSDGCHGFYGAKRDDVAGNYIKDDEGAFVQESRNAFYMKKAPAYLGCYDINRAGDSPEINWPETIQQTQNKVGGVAQNVACDAYASVCVEEEVGCNAYNPVGGGVQVPGIIGEGNQCESECVGYDVFRQEETIFEDTQFPLYFVPTDAEQCSETYVGCDEFTNIDELSRGGEGLEYYTDLKYCERPLASGENKKTYYSWEGSLSEGLAIKTHVLRPLLAADQQYIEAVLTEPEDAVLRAFYAEGGPAYADDSAAALRGYATACNEKTYNLKITDPYNDLAAGEKCRALYLDDTTVYYRLITELLTVSEACHPLRKTDTDVYVDTDLEDNDMNLCTGRHGTVVDGECVRCKDGGEYRGGVCIYSAITGVGESQSCPAQFDGCREYTGNTAGNVQEVFNQNFEAIEDDADSLAQELAEWGPEQRIIDGDIRIVAEATDVGLHSLQLLNGRGIRTVPTSTVRFEAGQFYELSFWARGRQQNVAIRMIQSGHVAGRNVSISIGTVASNVSIGDVWQEYRFGPIEIGDNVDPTQPVEISISQLNSDGSANNADGNVLFIDHYRLTRVQDTLTLIKDSWETRPEGYDVPLSCDKNPEDGLPGVALGCRAYEEEGSKGILRYATGFERLCRENAVGCRPLWDTYNTVEDSSPEKAHAYNVWCAGDENQECSVDIDDITLGSCQVIVGETGCYVDEIILPNALDFDALNNAGYIDASSVFIPEDTASSTPIFLAYRSEFQCNEAERGCMVTGQEQQLLPDATQPRSFGYSDVIVKNDPALYGEILCREGLVGCAEMAHGSEVSYFRDPSFTGNGLCSYKPSGVSAETYGWFLDGVGTCSNNSDYCVSDEQCGGNNTCEGEEGSVPCYEDFLRHGGEYGLWSNNTEDYDGFVGSCPDQYNQCTELVDPQDTSNINPDGKPYYVLFNEQMKNKLGECDQVGLRDGCVLFDKTDNPNKIYNSGATYAQSESQNPPYGFVDPIRSDDVDQNDTNLLMKVDRQRECSEWLACRTSVSVMNANGKRQSVCYQYQACEKIGTGSTCSRWVGDLNTPEDTSRALFRLTHDQYISRGVSWYDEELSGYSLYNKYQITNMMYLGFSFRQEIEDATALKSKKKETYIVRQFKNQIFNAANPESEKVENPCVENNSNWNICGFDAGGRCYSGKCIYPIDDVFKTVVEKVENEDGEFIPKVSNLVTLLDELTTNSCKGFPEEDSPFPASVSPAGEGKKLKGSPLLGRDDTDGKHYIFKSKQSNLSEVNVCQTGNCSCAYEKLNYKDGTVEYWPLGSDTRGDLTAPAGICTGGERVGQTCSVDSQCNPVIGEGENNPVNPGACSLLTKKDMKIGIEGFCLEYDVSRPISYGDEGYACLTWLPIQASASRFDIYNSYINAGYNPDEDADGFGELYCVDSTQSSQRVYDTRDGYFDLTNPRDSEQQLSVAEYSSYYLGGDTLCKTKRGLVGARTVDTIVKCDSVALWLPAASDGETRESVANRVFYTYFQTWAWEYLNNSVVLRFDKDITKSDETHQAVDGNEVGPAGRPRDLYSFGGDPTHGYIGYDSYGSDENGRANNWAVNRAMSAFIPYVNKGGNFVEELGVIMHPKRSFSNNGPHVSEYLLENITFPSEPGAPDSNVVMNTTAMSSEYAMYTPVETGVDNAHYYGPGHVHDLLYVSPFESELNEFDIKKIHFVPFGHHGRNDGEMPRMGKDGLMSIDFIGLRDSNNNAIMKEHHDFVSDGRMKSKDLLTWTYYLSEADINASNFENFIDYNRQIDPQDNILSDELEARNKIASRYVLVMSDSDRFDDHKGMPDFIPVNTEPGNDDIVPILDTILSPTTVVDGNPNDHDPFSVECGVNDGGSHWFAIGLDFNSKGEFLGYISRWCSDDGTDETDSYALNLLTAVELIDHCTEVTKVQDEGLPHTETLNKAWTNRVWNGATKWADENTRVPLKHPFNLYQDIINRITPSMPYGSLSMLRSEFEDGDALRRHTFSSVENGIPYSCNTPWLGTGDEYADTTSASKCSTGHGTAVDNVLSGANNTTAKTFGINQLFVKSFGIRRLNYTIEANGFINRVYESVLLDNEEGYDVGGTVGSDLMIPQIYSLNPFACEKTDTCRAAEKDNMTLNGKNAYISPDGKLADYDDDGVPDEDSDNDGRPDVLIRTGSFYSVLQFFAFADDNRMPIRRVMVDWGDDEITNRGKMGLYKNRKPVCGADDGGYADVGLCVDAAGDATGMTCDEDTGKHPCPTDQSCITAEKLGLGGLDEERRVRQFGNTDRACSENYFEFIHEYSCDAVTLAENNPNIIKTVREMGADAARLARIGLDLDDKVCVFVPRVQVMDNWGWCNGECTHSADDYEFGVIKSLVSGVEEGCYNDQETDIIGFNDDQCGFYMSNPSINNMNPWTNYGGKIIILPEEITQE